ncbi:uncharacterized protein K444DRAFT_666717 [Hyaloscypha bicolor E]|uniref:Uncharacterized protein n=1 Tax=Hyaloscypha bicolor E TaxID=1095630 RepID=A0A2J6SXH6_9HELO|nr:uncharacterized protein K444DRAFT_666717 [Hyaloscypha bicolor E]PMD55487.1 hypothetical protein K444DRAFT_666717 [Hyaloscypha bicolor E]
MAGRFVPVIVIFFRARASKFHLRGIPTFKENGQCQLQSGTTTGVTAGEIKSSIWLCNVQDSTHRCANTGYECNGYCYNALARRPPSNPFSTRSTDENSRVAIPRVSSTPCQLIVQPSAGPKLKNTIEHQYFTVFRESIADQLSGYYDTAIWNCVVLQACHDESWARNLVVAIGALYKSLGREESVRERKRHYLFALQTYGEALVQLKDYTRECKSDSDLRCALISSLLTTCFETYIGNKDNAITQAKVGIDILLEWTAKQQKEPADDMPDEWSNIRRVATQFYIHNDLLDVFQRLDYQLLLVRGLQPGRKSPGAFPSIDRPFISLDEACTFWDLVMRRILFFHSVKDVREQHSLQGYDKDNAQAEECNFKNAIQQFFRSFTPIFESSRRRPGTKEYFLSNLVMIRSLACRFAVLRFPSYSELYSDYFLRDYKLLIRLARELIDDSKMTQREAICNFDITLGISIFSLLHLCRVSAVRKEALDLLRQYPQREGWFDALVSAKISTWLMNEEEGGTVHGHIPDTARLRLIKHELGPHKRTAKLHCSRFVRKDGNATRELLPPITINL